jgi:nucleoside-diphosphate-sugar epimerase
MLKETILVTGANGQIGADLTRALRELYGKDRVIASDIYPANAILNAAGHYEQLDVRQPIPLAYCIRQFRVTQIYHLAAMLSANGEKDPAGAWELNMKGLFNVLEAAKELHVKKIFWPSSIAVFGQTSQKDNCPQHAVTEPATMYGISKLAGEQWCQWYFNKYGLDIRSLRFPGLISYTAPAGGGTTDYAVEMFHAAISNKSYTCFLQQHTKLPMMYMPDAIRATLQLMEAPAENIRIRTSYNISGISFTPAELASSIKHSGYETDVTYQPDYRQGIADCWPHVISDESARRDFGWQADYDLVNMTESMLFHLKKIYNPPEAV